MFVGKPEGKKQLEDQDGGWDDNIKMDLKERGWEGVNWTYLAQNRNETQSLINAVITFVGFIKCRYFLLVELLLTPEEGLWSKNLISSLQICSNFTVTMD
jgi:hypothetical protein